MEHFLDILKAHQSRYPLMKPRDFGKLIYQSEFGPGHLNATPEGMEQALREEWAEMTQSSRNGGLECIGGNYCRIHFSPDQDPDLVVPLLARLCYLSMDPKAGTQKGLRDRLEMAYKLEIPGMRQWGEDYCREGCPPLRHTRQYRELYLPHYRVIRRDYAQLYPLFLAIARLYREKSPVVVAIDGRCGSGKTWLADRIGEIFPCNLVRMDDFYLPKEQRAPDWRNRTGGNMALNRFRQEIAIPLRSGEKVNYRAFCCGCQDWKSKPFDTEKWLTVVEGSYSMHPHLGLEPELTVFLTCSDETQVSRLCRREDGNIQSFLDCWIPMSEVYLREWRIENNATLVINTDMFTGH